MFIVRVNVAFTFADADGSLLVQADDSGWVSVGRGSFALAV